FSTSTSASSLSSAHSSFHEDRTVDTVLVTGESEHPTTSTVFCNCRLSWVMRIAWTMIARLGSITFFWRWVVVPTLDTLFRTGNCLTTGRSLSASVQTF